MFAPKVAKRQTKLTEGPTQRTIGNQATLRLLAQQASRSDRRDLKQEVASEQMVAREVIAGVSWDFLRIPVHAPGPRGMLAEPRSAPSQLPFFIQQKFEIGAVGDPFELEADRVAERVMRIAAPRISVTSARPLINHKCAECEKENEDKKKLRLKPAGLSGEQAGEAPGSVSDVLQLPGQPLDGPTRAYFEPRFGHDFASVRVHTDAHAAASAAAIGAVAYTYGPHIAFAAGRYEPTTISGRRLLAHELTHVLQQGSTDGRLAGLPLAVSDPSDAAEAEADRAADEALMQRESSSPHRIRALIARRVSRTIQRQTCTSGGSNEVPSGLNLSGFEQESSTLPGKYYAPLRTLAERLKRSGGSAEVQVHGFASREGDAAFNIRLSCARAFGVKQVIQANGVRNAISLVAHGATTALGTDLGDNRAVIVVESTPAKTPEEEKKPHEEASKEKDVGASSVTIGAADTGKDPCRPRDKRIDLEIEWSTTGRNGYIVQEIQRTRLARPCEKGKGKGDFVEFEKPEHFWEVWEVSADGKITCGGSASCNVDHWGFTVFPGTEMRQVIDGNVYWATTLDPSFKPNPRQGNQLTTTKKPGGLGPVLLTRQHMEATFNDCQDPPDCSVKLGPKK
jgi:outer membrane protein OmpA-like peptidoglycan-associated protein